MRSATTSDGWRHRSDGPNDVDIVALSYLATWQRHGSPDHSDWSSANSSAGKLALRRAAHCAHDSDGRPRRDCLRRHSRYGARSFARRAWRHQESGRAARKSRYNGRSGPRETNAVLVDLLQPWKQTTHVKLARTNSDYWIGSLTGWVNVERSTQHDSLLRWISGRSWTCCDRWRKKRL